MVVRPDNVQCDRHCLPFLLLGWLRHLRHHASREVLKTAITPTLAS